MATVTDVVSALEDQVWATLDDPSALASATQGARPADLADVLDRLHKPERVTVFRQLGAPLAARVLFEASTEVTRELLDTLPLEESVPLLERLPMDELARVLSEDAPHRRDELLAALGKATAARARMLLSYPDHSAGRLMTEQFPTVEETMTAEQAIVHLREVHGDCETITDLYSLDADRKPRGVLSLRELDHRRTNDDHCVAPAPRRRLGRSGGRSGRGCAPRLPL